MKIKTASDLKYFVESMGKEPHFFTRSTMRFFGDTMRNYGVKNHPSYIELIRKRPVKHGQMSSAYFDRATGQRILNLERFLAEQTNNQPEAA